jgi:hypothetical protein
MLCHLTLRCPNAILKGVLQRGFDVYRKRMPFQLFHFGPSSFGIEIVGLRLRCIPAQQLLLLFPLLLGIQTIRHKRESNMTMRLGLHDFKSLVLHLR